MSGPEVNLSVGVPVKISYLLDGSEPAHWEITVPDGVNLMNYAILFPMCLPPLQFIIVDDGTFFNGTFRSVAMVTRDNTSFTLNIIGYGLVIDGNLTTITFDATAYGDFDLTSYTYDLSALSVSYNVSEGTRGQVVLSTFIEADLPLTVIFEYTSEGDGQRFDNQIFQINQSAVTVVDNNRLVFDVTSSLVPGKCIFRVYVNAIWLAYSPYSESKY